MQVNGIQSGELIEHIYHTNIKKMSIKRIIHTADRRDSDYLNHASEYTSPGNSLFKVFSLQNSIPSIPFYEMFLRFFNRAL